MSKDKSKDRWIIRQTEQYDCGTKIVTYLTETDNRWSDELSDAKVFDSLLHTPRFTMVPWSTYEIVRAE